MSLFQNLIYLTSTQLIKQTHLKASLHFVSHIFFFIAISSTGKLFYFNVLVLETTNLILQLQK